MLRFWRTRDYKIKVLVLIVVDIILINMCSLASLLVRFDFKYSMIDRIYLDRAIEYAPINTLVLLGVIALCKLYSSIWTYASINELMNVIRVVGINFVVQILGMHVIFKLAMPRSYYVLYAMFLLCALTGVRFSYRFMRRVKRYSPKDNNITNVMIVGAGEAGTMVAREMMVSHNLNKEVKCFIDDNESKKRRYLLGIPIAGNRVDIPEVINRYHIDEIYVAMPSVKPEVQREILKICNETGKSIKVLPGMYQLVNGDVSISKFRNVEIEDLLGRETVSVDMSDIKSTIQNKVVLVTGGGGSIGSELCRQIAGYEPKELIIFDIYENNAYDIQQELKRTYGDNLKLTVLIGSVRNTHRIDTIFQEYKPEVVFHAAAHKHVPLMEDSPNEAIKNNVFGTYNVAAAAGKYGTKRFVLISTDKAVNPTNIMGASKRLCEMIVQYFDTLYDTEYVAVRFGNVLGSNGSVIPLFKKQIQEGGPVTVTHKDIIRYFMTIPEAVSLVLQAEAYAKGGEIFVLDMGEPVRIDTLARNLIKLSGLTPDVDIKIEYTGLRPGEKLFEEMLMHEEGLKQTDNHLIHIGQPIEMDYQSFERSLVELRRICELDGDGTDIRRQVQAMVPTYTPKGQ